MTKIAEKTANQIASLSQEDKEYLLPHLVPTFEAYDDIEDMFSSNPFTPNGSVLNCRLDYLR